MKFKIFLLIFTMLSLCVSAVSAQVTKEDIEKALPKKLEHPYLFFSVKDKPAILERIKTDTESHDIMQRLIAETNRLIYTPIEDAPIMDKNPRFTGDWGYNQYMFRYAENAFKLAFMYQMTGD